MSTRRFSTLAVSLLFASTFAIGQQTAVCSSWSYFVTPAPYNAAFQPSGINHYGTVVGDASSTTVKKGFIRSSNGHIALVSFPGSNYTALTKRSSSGVSVGYYLPTPASQPNGLLLSPNGSFATLNFPGSVSTNLWGINGANTIVGSYTTTVGGNTQGFEYSHGKFTSIQFPGAVQTIPRGINDRGVVVGMYWIGNLENPSLGFTLQNGVYKKFGGANTQPSDINNAGTIVDLNALLINGRLKQVIVPGASESFVWGINDLGIITGDASYDKGNNNFIWKGFTARCK